MNKYRLIILPILAVLVFSLGCDAEVVNLDVIPDSYDFGRVNIGDSTGYIFRIYNNSPNSVSIRGMEMFGGSSGDFFISNGNTASKVLSPGEIHKVTLKFQPKEENLRTAIFRVRSTARNVYTSVQLIGTGQKVGRINIPEANYSFGSVYTSTPKDHTFEVQNTGTSQLVVTDYKFIGIGEPYYSITGGFGPLIIKTGESGTFTVKCAPTAVGTFPAILEVSHTGANQNPLRMNLTCSGVDKAPEFKLNVTGPIDFGLVDTIGFKTEQVRITNDGNAPLTVASITLNTNVDFSFVEAQDKTNTPISLPAQVSQGDYILAIFKFVPTGKGNFQDKILFEHDGINEFSPYELEVKGEGSGVVKFDTPGTYNWTVPAGITSVKVLVVGGGGGGSGSHYGAGGSGWVVVQTVTVSPGSSIPIVVGAGGTGGIVGTNNSPGGHGKDSTFNTSIIASGGKGGGGGGAGYYTGGDGGSGGGGAGNSGFAGKGGSAGSNGDPGDDYAGGLGGHFDSLSGFTGNLTAGAGGAAGTSSHAGGGGAGGVLHNGNGPSGGDGGDTWSGKGGKGYGAGGGSGGYSSTTGTRPGGGAGADGMVYLEY